MISAFNKNEVYYLNNIKSTFYELTTNRNIAIDRILKYHTVTNDNKYCLNIDKKIRKNLVGTKDMKEFLYGKKKIKILIISIENKKVDKMDMLSDLFIKYKHIYECIVIRDILNLFSSRLEYEKKIINNDRYETDDETVNYWLDNYYNSQNTDYIVFNYNKFLCYKKSMKSLAEKLNIDYTKTKDTLNLYGLTYGSSFGNIITDNSDYFMRWVKYKNNPLMINLINNDKIIKILCKDFSMCLYFNNKNM